MTKTAQENIYINLRKMIIAGRLRPGEKIGEHSLAKKFGYSRVPVRESLIRLKAEGFVSSKANKGFVVRKYTRKDVIELFEIRELIEVFAAGRAADFATDQQIETIEQAHLSMEKFIERFEKTGEFVMEEKVNSDLTFHSSIIDASNNSHLHDTLKRTHRDQIFLFSPSVHTIEYWLNDTREVCDIHKQILEAIKNRKPDEARDCMSRHIQKACESSLKALDTHFQDDFF